MEQLNKDVVDRVENLDKVQMQLNGINDQASAEIIRIEQKYNEMRKPLFEKRQVFIDGIPNFWLTVVGPSDTTFLIFEFSLSAILSLAPF